METLNPRKPSATLLDPDILWPAIGASFVKLDPRAMARNPVMFVVEVVAALTTVIFVRDLVAGGEQLLFTFQIMAWLWFTVLFANFAEAVAEGRGKAQADALRKTRTETMAKRLTGDDRSAYEIGSGGRTEDRRCGAGGGRRYDSLGRRGDRGRCLRQRGRHHG